MGKNEAEDAIYKKLKEIRDIMEEYAEIPVNAFICITFTNEGDRFYRFTMDKEGSKPGDKSLIDFLFVESQENNGKSEVCGISFFD